MKESTDTILKKRGAGTTQALICDAKHTAIAGGIGLSAEELKSCIYRSLCYKGKAKFLLTVDAYQIEW